MCSAVSFDNLLGVNIYYIWVIMSPEAVYIVYYYAIIAFLRNTISGFSLRQGQEAQMRNKVKRNNVRRLTAVLLMLLMIMGSFSAASFAQEAPEEEAAKTTVTAPAESAAPVEKQPSAGGNENVTAEEQSVPDVQTEASTVQPESAAVQSESAEVRTEVDAVQPKMLSAQPEAAAEGEGKTSLNAAAGSEMNANESSDDKTKKITVSYSQVPNGKLSASLKTDDGETPLASGDTVDLPGKEYDRIIFTEEPDDGYKIKQLTITNGDETNVFTSAMFERMRSNQLSLKLSLVKGDISFTAEFEVRKYKLEVDPYIGGTVTVDKTEAAKGDTVTVDAVADDGYRIKYVAYAYQGDQWDEYVYLKKDPATGKYTFTMPGRDIYVLGSFFKPLTIKIKESAGGSVTLKDRETGKEIKNGDEIEPYKQIIVSAKANSGYSFDTWNFTADDGSYVSFFKRDSYIRVRDSGVTVEAVFKRTSTSTSGSGGSSSSSGSSSSYSGGSSVPYMAAAETPVEPEEPEARTEELTTEEQEMIDVTPIVSKVVAETVLTATTSLFRYLG